MTPARHQRPAEPAPQPTALPDDINPAPPITTDVQAVLDAWANGSRPPARPVLIRAADLTADCLDRQVEIHSILALDGRTPGQQVQGRWLFTLDRLEVTTRRVEPGGTYEHIYRLHTAGAGATTLNVAADTPVFVYGPISTEVAVVALPSRAFISQTVTGAPPAPPGRGPLTTVPTPGPPWDSTDQPPHTGHGTPPERQPSAQPTAASGPPPHAPQSSPPSQPVSPAGPPAEPGPSPQPPIPSGWPELEPLPPQPGGSGWSPQH